MGGDAALLGRQLKGVAFHPIEPGYAADVGCEYLSQFHVSVGSKGGNGNLLPPPVASTHGGPCCQQIPRFGVDHDLNFLSGVALGDDDFPMSVAVEVRPDG